MVLSADPRPAAEVFDEHGRTYSETVNRAVGFVGLDVDFFTRVKAGYILDICESVFANTSDVRALDVGCGVGNFHGLLGPHFRSLAGVDVSAASVEIAAARELPNTNYDVYDGKELPYEDETFDLAFTICVMHHVPPPQWEAFSREMFRVLRKGGLALVFEHNPLNPLTLRAVNNCPFDEDAVLLSARTTVGLLKTAGFTDIARRSILSVPAGNRLLRNVDRIFSHLPLGAQYYVRARRG
jgi:SAM-dependent methyltransferase